MNLTPEELKRLKEIVDDGTTTVTIPTPEGWECEKEGCQIDYKHTHSALVD